MAARAMADDVLEDTYVTARGGCSNCGSLSYSQEWLVAFSVYLCQECKRNENLISKGTAKELYVVTDGDLKKLGSLSKSNPHKRDWSQMRLFLESQVQDMAYSKHGGPEGVENARDIMVSRRTENKMKKRRLQEDQEEKEQHRMEILKNKLGNATADEHAIQEESFNASTGKYERHYSDGITVDVEKL
eukprot:jgi/Botrbrau1/8246/Bobra.0001s0004.1